ncbi:hypothetical protein CC78DRAFT_539980 [Lojkania enalia]|uniref:Lytic polysaccharide monooxygenase n=1 Tax=Lojkania enalia TaxID=147567 RepID=A0A9P4NA55_9PLEO|nr:hypothetical protein CC78DRAFT_539980 [Didymosphaeria enalia]
MHFGQSISVLALAVVAHGHIVMDIPRPYDYDNLNNSPLFEADFPCKQPNGPYTVVEMNHLTSGQQQLVNFKGTAVHGGGSCQFSITTDLKPSRDTKWGVIHTIEGNCPASGMNGQNYPGLDPQHSGKDRYPLVIPPEVPSGQYSLAWTWINQVGGQGEFYMNCAPITVTSDTVADEKSLAYLNSLPPMFVANLQGASQECVTLTGGGKDWVYPDEFKGDSVEKMPGLIPQSWDKTAGCASMTLLGEGSGTMTMPQEATGIDSFPSAPTKAAQDGVIYVVDGEAQPTGGVESPSSPVGGQPIATSAIAVPSNTLDGGVFAPGASSGAEQPQTSFKTVATPTVALPPPTSAVQASVPPTSTGASPSSPSRDGISCPENGKIVCIGTSQWGTCNFGKAVPQALAAGTFCENGTIMAMKLGRRNVHPHFHRRHGSHPF